MSKFLKYKVYAKVDPIYSIHSRVLRLHRPKFKRLKSLVKKDFLFSKQSHFVLYPNAQADQDERDEYKISKEYKDYNEEAMVNLMEKENFFKKWFSTTILERTKRKKLAKLLNCEVRYEKPDNDNKKFGFSSKKRNFKDSKNNKFKGSFNNQRNFKSNEQRNFRPNQRRNFDSNKQKNFNPNERRNFNPKEQRNFDSFKPKDFPKRR